MVYGTQARLLSSWISRVISVPPRIRTGFQIDLYPSEHCQHVKVRTVKFSFTESSAKYVDTIQAVQAKPSGRPKRQGFTSQFHSPVCVRRTVWSSTAVVVTNLLSRPASRSTMLCPVHRYPQNSFLSPSQTESQCHTPPLACCACIKTRNMTELLHTPPHPWSFDYG